MNRDTLRMLELVWLVIGLLGVAAGIYNLVTGNGESSMFFIIALLALMMYFYRRHLRRNHPEN